MLRVDEYVNTVQNDTNNGWDDGATNDSGSDDGGAEQSAPSSVWDQIKAGDVRGLANDVENVVGRVMSQDIYSGIIKPFAEGAEGAFNQIAAANNQQTNAITQSIEDLGADPDTQSQDMQQIEDASNYRNAAGKEVLNGPAMLVPQIAAPVFVGDAVNTAMDNGIGAGVRSATYGPLADFLSQENLGDRFVEQPITTAGQAILSALPIGVAGHLGYKGIKGAKAKYKEGMTDFEKEMSDLEDNTYNAPDAAEPIRENEPQEAYTEQDTNIPEEPQAEAPQQPGGIDTGIDSGIDSMVNAAAAHNGVDPALLAKLVDQESTYGRDPNAGGNLAQVSDDLAARYGLDSSDPSQSIEAGARYLKEQLDANGGDMREALAAYNAGPGNKQAGYGYADSVLGRDIGGDIGQSGGGSSGGAYEQGADSWMGARMPSGSEGCVEAATRVGSFYDPFLKEEADRGVSGVPRLVEDAGDRVIPFDESKLEKGDVIVYGDNDHVVTYDGNGGYVGNSTSQGKIVHGSNYHEMGNMSPTKIIKTSDRSSGSMRNDTADTSAYDDAILAEDRSIEDSNNDVNNESTEPQDVADQMRQDVQDVVDKQFANINKPTDVKWDESKPAEEAKGPTESQMREDVDRALNGEDINAPREEAKTSALDSAIDQLKNERQKMIDEQVQFYKDTPGGKGTDSAPIYDEYGERKGTAGISNNPQWYQDAYDYFGGKPPKSRMAEFAEQDLMANDERFSNLDLQIRRMDEYRKRINENPASDPNEVAQSVADDIRYSKERVETPQDTAGEANAPDGTITMRNIYKRAQELFTPIRTGRMKSGNGHKASGILGQYMPDADVVRSRDYGDIRTISHELGHAIDEKLNLSGSPLYNAEFAKVVNSRFVGKYKPQEIPGEGVAEFMHDYLQDPSVAKKNFPTFYNKFMSKMDANPETFAKIEEMRDMVQKYNSQSAEARGRSAVSYEYEREPSPMEKLKNAWHSFVEGVVDDKDALQRAQESYNRLTGKVADTAQDAYKQARLAMNSSMARAQMMVEGKKSSLIRNTLNKIYGDVAGENFHTIKEILSTLDKSVKGKYGDYLKSGGFKNWHEALDSLLVARRSIEIKDTRIREAQDAQADIEFRAADVRRKLAGLENTKKALDRSLATDEIRQQTAKVNRSIDNLQNQLKTLARDHTAAVESVKQAKAYKTAMSMDDARAISKNAPEELTKAAKDIYRYNDTVLHIMQKTGMISEKTYNVLHEKYHNYVPLARDFADEAGIIKGFGMGGDGFANVAKALKKLSDTGSTRQVKSPLESMVDNTYKLLSMAERNKVGQIFADWGKTKGAGKLIEEVVGTAKSKDSTFKVWIDGKEHVYATTPELYRAITSMNRETSNIITKLLSPPAGLLRAGATLMPDFALKNIMRDSFGAAVFSRYGFRPVIDHVAGIFHMLKQDQLFQDYKASGALMSTMVGLDRDFVQASLKGLYKKNASYYWKNYNPVQILRGFSEMLETATRLGEYGRAVKKGVSVDDAALSARDISLDFSKAGTYGRTINKVSAFFNAGVQEPARIFQAFKEAPAKTAVKTALYITLPSVALWSMNHNQEWYKELPEYQKNIFWCFKAGNTIYRIPKPFGLGVLFGSLPERALDYAYNKNPQSLKKWIESAKDAFLPNLAPTAVVPIVEWMSNYSFFRGRSIVPGRLEKMPDAMQYGPNTSNMAKDIGKMFNLSPMKVDNLIRGYGAGMATQSLNAWDATHGDRPMDNPFKKAFTVDPLQSPQSVQNFYDKMDEAEKAYNGAGGKAKATGSVSYNYQLMQHANKVMQDLNKQERAAVQAHDQSKIDAINAKQLKAAQDALKLYK